LRLPQLAVENRHFTITVITLLVVFGVYAFLTMPRTEDPQIEVPGGSVTVIYPGANPIDLEHLVVDPLEEALNEIEDVRRIESFSGDGLADVAVEFEFGTDPDEKFREFMDKINTVRQDLPEGIIKVDTFKWEVGTVNILQLALVSETATYRDLKRTAEELKDSLERIGGVREVEIWACPEQELRIAMDLERMARMNISIGQVIRAIQASNASIPGGSIDTGGRKFNVRSSGEYESLEEIESTIINTSSGGLVYLRDIADIYFANEEKDYHARFNGERAIFITLNQKNYTNIFSIMNRINPVIDEFKSSLPQSIRLYYAFNQSKSVERRFNLFFANLFQGIVLVGLIVFLGVGLRSSIIVVLAIPFSLFIGIGFVHLTGYALQQISIAGLVIVLGILVDNAIVVTENVSRFIHMGYDPKEAAIKGTGQVAWAITSATVTTVLAFVPIILMQDKSGDFIRSMPVTVVYTLTASLLIALTFTPYLTSVALRKNGKGNISWMQKRLSYFIRNHYRRFLESCLSHPALVLGTAALVFFISIATFVFFVGVSFFPKAEKPQFLINVYTPEGTSIERTDEVVRFVESVLEERDEIVRVASNIGQGNPRIYYNVYSEYESSNYGQLFIELNEYHPQRTEKLLSDLRERFRDYPGAQIEVTELAQGPPVEAPVAIKIITKRLDDLERLSRDVERLFEGTPGLMNIYNPLRTSKTDLHVKINREKAGMLGLPLIDIDRAIRVSLSGLIVSTYRDSEGEDYDIVLRLKSSSARDRARIYDFDRIYLASVTGAQIPLKQVAIVQFKSGPVEIRHYNLERSVTITADVMSHYSVSEVTNRVIERLERYNWPSGTRYHVAGEAEGREESFGGMGIAIIIAMVAIFGVLILQFRSFSQPFIIFSSLPLAFIGSIFALFLSGYTFSFTAFVGLTSLVGIVVNDAIILVDYTNQLIREGKEMTSAIKEAGEVRFMSIILTSATTIGGLLPLTLRGGTLWAPMGLTIMGGLLTSTVLTLVIVPVLYKTFSRYTARSVAQGLDV
jgi:multidrug efflux pump subunit AcrB